VAAADWSDMASEDLLRIGTDGAAADSLRSTALAAGPQVLSGAGARTMSVLVVLATAALLSRLLGVAGVEFLNSWPAATRAGLAVMLLFTGSAHFNSMRHDLARMVPPAIPHPVALIYFTGICEILGGIGLLIAPTRSAAAVALIIFLVAVLPANVHAARAGVQLRGRPATPLALRIPMQILFIALTWWAGIYCRL
jgi:uncharacterized membrane protein